MLFFELFVYLGELCLFCDEFVATHLAPVWSRWFHLFLTILLMHRPAECRREQKLP